MGTVGARATPDVEHDNRVSAAVDLIQHAPVPVEPGTVDSNELVGKLLTDPLRAAVQ